MVRTHKPGCAAPPLADISSPKVASSGLYPAIAKVRTYFISFHLLKGSITPY
jgi:hypothetical protein